MSHTDESTPRADEQGHLHRHMGYVKNPGITHALTILAEDLAEDAHPALTLATRLDLLTLGAIFDRDLDRPNGAGSTLPEEVADHTGASPRETVRRLSTLADLGYLVHQYSVDAGVYVWTLPQYVRVPS